MTNVTTTAKERYVALGSPTFLHALLEGMHTMAQPLTVLRATLEIASGNASCISQYQRAVDSSLVEVTRMSEAMGFVQELVRIASDTAEPMAVEFPVVAETVREDLRCVFETSRVWLDVVWKSDLPWVQVSVSRLRKCLFYLLQHAVRATCEGDTIHLSAEAGVKRLCVYVSSESPSVLDREMAWNQCLHWNGIAPYLALAEVLANVDGGHLQWKMDPFAAALWLPAAE